MKPIPELGKRYYRKRGMTASVRLVTKIEGDKVFWRLLYGPGAKKHPEGQTTLNGMKRWMTAEYSGDENYYRLDGAVIYQSYLVQNVDGETAFRCGRKRALFYLRKGYAVEVGDHLIKLVTSETVDRLKQLHGEELTPFFMAVKNQKCVVCGVDRPLTRHHVVPRRVTKILPKTVKCRISNILFVCVKCHSKYNDNDIQHEELDPQAWVDHFNKVMEPKQLPEGWTIFTVKEGVLDENGDPPPLQPVPVYTDQVVETPGGV
jgi:uncharacterized C2H2 Zn-finger protein